MTPIINELNLENGSNYKLEILKKYKDNQLLKKLLKMTYDKVSFTYGITMKNIPERKDHTGILTLENALNNLEKDFCTRNFTGHKAINELYILLEMLSEEDDLIIQKVLDRDLKVNLGRTQINKVFKNLIIKPPYMRCATYNEKTAKKISFPAILQIKCDGMFQYVIVANGKVSFQSRAGEERKLKHLEEIFKTFPDGIYVGELLVHHTNDRATANGFINSDEEDKSRVYMKLWDYIEFDDFNRPKEKTNKIFYKDRLETLKNILKEKEQYLLNVVLVETYTVDNLQQALKQVGKWMRDGEEGGVLKDNKNIFIDHTSPTQLKLKLEISVEMRCTGFQEGKKGTKREGKIGSLIFENDEGTIKGRCSGFTDKQLDEFTNNFENYKNQILEVQFNDLTRSENNEYYALSHPRFIEWRSDKDQTDTLKKAFELRNSAMLLEE